MAVKKLIPESPRAYAYIVDFFGILIPGITFVSLSLPLIFGVLNLIAFFNINFSRSILDLALSVRWEFTVFAVILSYFFGIIFFRKGAKDVDARSVKRNWKDIKGDHPPVSSEKDVEWPYDNLKDYLGMRLPHLSDLVPWECKPDKTNNSNNGNGNNSTCQEFNRSKTFMNVLKSNIRYWCPDKYFVIARNEAHVRLSSSAWHAMNTIVNIAIISLICGGILYTVEFFIAEKDIFSSKIYIYNFYLAFSIVLIAMGIFIKGSIEKFIHYQRVREIVFILNIAFQANKEKPKFASEFDFFQKVRQSRNLLRR